MFTKLGSITAAAAVALALGVSSAGARPAVRPRATGLGVIAAVSQTGATVTASFVFTGSDATGFIIAVPHNGSLSTLKFARIGRDLSLSTITGVKVHYILTRSRPGYLAIALHAPQADLRLTFTRALFTFSSAESRLISSHAVRSVGMGIAFAGVPGVAITSRFKLDV
jgi:hypothetical protein